MSFFISNVFMGTKYCYASKILLVGLEGSVRKNNIISPQEESCHSWLMLKNKKKLLQQPVSLLSNLPTELWLYWINDNHFWPEETSHGMILISAFQMDVWVTWHLYQEPAAHRVSSGLQTSIQSKGPSAVIQMWLAMSACLSPEHICDLFVSPLCNYRHNLEFQLQVLILCIASSVNIKV